MEDILPISALTLTALVEKLRAITRETTDPAKIVDRVRPLAKQMALSKGWLRESLYEADQAQGFGLTLLHEEADHSLAIYAVSWLPRRGAPAHNHGTWAVVAGVHGIENNALWERLDKGDQRGFAKLRKKSEIAIGPGDVVSFLPDTIHSVVNEDDDISLSLHIYGQHLNYTGRSKFDIENGTEQPFIVTVR